ncbi:MAG: hypothetical protein ACREUW_04650 [Burkholderiales bacterium]
MNITSFLAGVGFKPYSSVVNSWDSFDKSGSVLMQLWVDPGQRVRDHPNPYAYLRVRCWNAASHARKGHTQVVGYNGRAKAIAAIENGAKGYAALSDAPEEKRGAGVWAKNADLSKVYPVLGIEREETTSDIFAILGKPVSTQSIGSGGES